MNADADRSPATLTRIELRRVAMPLVAPFRTSFEMELPIPWSKVSAVAIPLSLAGGWLLLRRARKPATDEP